MEPSAANYNASATQSNEGSDSIITGKCRYYLGNGSSGGGPNNEVWHWVEISGCAGCGAFGVCLGVDGCMYTDQDWDEDETDISITHRAWFGIHAHPYYQDNAGSSDGNVDGNGECTQQHWCVSEDDSLKGFRDKADSNSDSSAWLPAWHLHDIQTEEDGTMLEWYSDYVGTSVDSITGSGVNMYSRHPDTTSCNNYPLDNCPIGDGNKFDLEDMPELWDEYEWCIRGRADGSANWEYASINNIRFDFRNERYEDHNQNEVARVKFEWEYDDSNLRRNLGWEYQVGFRCTKSSIGCPTTSEYFCDIGHC
tara:strand:+ start:40 stop:966 length:927 start_codon:yes stop_codon:yes gene_type:complete